MNMNRRRYLRLVGGLCGAGGLAGCLTRRNPADSSTVTPTRVPTDTPTRTPTEEPTETPLEDLQGVYGRQARITLADQDMPDDAPFDISVEMTRPYTTDRRPATLRITMENGPRSVLVEQHPGQLADPPLCGLFHYAASEDSTLKLSPRDDGYDPSEVRRRTPRKWSLGSGAGSFDTCVGRPLRANVTADGHYEVWDRGGDSAYYPQGTHRFEQEVEWESIPGRGTLTAANDGYANQATVAFTLEVHKPYDA